MLEKALSIWLAASLNSGGVSLYKWLTLEGSVSSQFGMIGILIDRESHQISRVRRISPAFDAGLMKKDVVISADGEKDIDFIDGMAYTKVHLVIKRGESTFEVDVLRVPKSEIKG